MFRMLKVILLFILVLALILAAGYLLFKDTLAEKAKTMFEMRLSGIFKQEIDIGSIKYRPLGSFTLKDVTIADNIQLQNITIKLNLFAMLKDRKFQSTVRVKSLKIKDLEVSGTLKTASLRAESYKDIFDPSLLKIISLTDGEIKTKLFSLRDIKGEVDIEETGYQSSFYTDGLRIDLEAKLNDPDNLEKGVEATAKIETDIEKLSTFSGTLGSFVKNCNASGKISSEVSTFLKIEDILSSEVNAKFDSDRIEFNKIKVGNIHGGFYIKKERFNMPSVTATFYGGAVSSNLDMDLHDNDLPFVFTLKVENSKFGNMLRDAINDKVNVYGDLFLDLSLKGNVPDTSTYTGKGELTILDADLGPMPILTPLLGNIYGYLQKLIPAMERVTITSAGATLDIKDRKITSDNLVLWGKEVFITAKGYMDFNGNLDFAVENQLLQQDEEDLGSWQDIFRRAITGFGKIISKAHLRGTLQKPKWEFEYLTPLADMFQKSVSEFIDTSQ